MPHLPVASLKTINHYKMPRIPSTLRRRHRLIQILRQHKTQNMENIPPFPPQMKNPPIIYVQPPLAQDYQPLSWIYMGLLGHAVSFNLQIHGQVSHLPKHPLPSIVDNRGDEARSEQLLKPSMAKQNLAPTRTILEPTLGTYNEESVEHATSSTLYNPRIYSRTCPSSHQKCSRN